MKDEQQKFNERIVQLIEDHFGFTKTNTRNFKLIVDVVGRIIRCLEMFSKLFGLLVFIIAALIINQFIDIISQIPWLSIRAKTFIEWLAPIAGAALVSATIWYAVKRLLDPAKAGTSAMRRTNDSDE